MSGGAGWQHVPAALWDEAARWHESTCAGEQPQFRRRRRLRHARRLTAAVTAACRPASTRSSAELLLLHAGALAAEGRLRSRQPHRRKWRQRSGVMRWRRHIKLSRPPLPPAHSHRFHAAHRSFSPLCSPVNRETRSPWRRRRQLGRRWRCCSPGGVWNWGGGARRHRASAHRASAAPLKAGLWRRRRPARRPCLAGRGHAGLPVRLQCGAVHTRHPRPALPGGQPRGPPHGPRPLPLQAPAGGGGAGPRQGHDHRVRRPDPQAPQGPHRRRRHPGVAPAAAATPRAARPSLLPPDCRTGTRAPTQSPLPPCACPQEFLSLAFSADGRHLAAQGGAPEWALSLWLWDKSKLVASVRTVSTPGHTAAQCLFQPGGRRAAA